MSLTDGDCVRLCLDGRPEIFRVLVARYEGPLIGFLAARLGREEAIEAAQETMVRAYFALSKVRKPDSFFPWLLGIAERVAKETRRSRRQAALIAEATTRDGSVSGPERGDPLDTELSQAVAALPDPYRQVVLLRFHGGQSCAEISRNLGVSLGTITSRLSRAYALLRQDLGEPVRAKENES